MNQYSRPSIRIGAGGSSKAWPPPKCIRSYPKKSFLDKSDTKTYYTNFADELLEITESPGEYSVSNMESYYTKVNRYIAEHEDHIAIYKLKNNKRLNDQDYQTLESILWKELGSKEEYSQVFGDTPLTLLVRKITGLAAEAAMNIVSIIDEIKKNAEELESA